MLGKFLYEYAVIRVVPKVEREEFINVGLIMFCKRAKFLKVRFAVHEQKLALYHPEFDPQWLYLHFDTFEKICSGTAAGGTIGGLDIPERFRWLTAVRSACIQTSRPHAGFTEDLEKTFDRLFEELVL
ncbi:MAG: DUF3037 domain-containing protein [Rikenellaceae bacterium]|nr:DUF3037 domain-containing protein [Rikenellaceae bacterium]